MNSTAESSTARKRRTLVFLLLGGGFAVACTIGLVILAIVLVTKRVREFTGSSPSALHGQTVQYPLPELKDDPAARARAPLDTPDFLDGSMFHVMGDLNSFGEPTLQRATAAAEKVEELKRNRPQAVARRPYEVPQVPNADTEKKHRKRFREYRRRELEAYRRLTTDTGESKLAGERFLEAFLGLNTKNPDESSFEEFENIVELSRIVHESGSNDPLVRSYAAYIQYQFTGDADAAEKVYSQTVLQLRETEYPLVVHAVTRWMIRELKEARATRGGDKRRNALAVAIVRWLEQEADHPEWTDCTLTLLQQLTCAESQGQGKMDTQLRREYLLGCFQSEAVEPYILHTIAGQVFVEEAWNRRGGAYAYKVTPEQRQGFNEFLQSAAAHLQYAWLLRPELPHAPSQMIPVAKAGFDATYKPYDWFLRTVECRFDYNSAYWGLFDSLRPRWGGSYSAMNDFASHCLLTDRFDTLVPYILLDFLREMEASEAAAAHNPAMGFQFDLLLSRFHLNRQVYRDGHPDAELAGDTAYYRTRLGLLLKERGRTAVALAEFRAAYGDVDRGQLQTTDRYALHELRRYHAAVGDVEERVLSFDRKLRHRWPANATVEELNGLEAELQELKETASDKWAEDYYKHAGAMLQSLRTYFQGDWVEFNVSDGGPGWEIRADRFLFETDGSLLIPRNWGKVDETWVRPVFHVEPPFTVEMDVEHVNSSYRHQPVAIRWRAPGDPGKRERAETEPFVLLDGRWSYNEGSNSRNYGESVRFSSILAQNPLSSFFECERPQLRHIHLNLWKQAVESSVDSNWSAVRLTEPIAPDGILTIGDLQPPYLRIKAAAFRLRNIRLRRLATAPPPDRDAPIDTRNAYWSARLEQTPDDVVAVMQSCKTRLQQGRWQDVLDQTQRISERWPSVLYLRGLRAQALVQARQYQKANDEFNAAFGESPNESAMWPVAAEFYAAVPDDSLRNGKQAMNLARVAVYNLEPWESVTPAVHAAHAAAAAELGDFEEAKKLNLQAIGLADDDLKQQLLQRQKLYESATPLRLPPAATPSPETEPTENTDTTDSQ